MYRINYARRSEVFSVMGRVSRNSCGLDEVIDSTGEVYLDNYSETWIFVQQFKSGAHVVRPYWPTLCV